MHKFFRYVFAIIASTTVLAGIPIGLYLVIAIISNDPGGFLVPFLLPILAVIGASLISCILFTPMALILKWLSFKFEWHMLTPLILAFFSFCLIAVFLTCFNVHPDFYSATYTAALIYVVFLSTGFVIYWLTLLWCEPILLFLYKKLKSNQSF
jgi:hypothetical protein